MTILHKTLFTVSIAGLEFKPGLIPTLLTIFIVYIFISLGQWQLSRADEKDYLQSLIETRQSLPPVSLDYLPENPEERLYLPVVVQGKYDAQHNMLLDNKVVNRRAGYDVYTPLLLEDGRALLINRGWLPQGKTRSDLPQITTPTQTLELTGLLLQPPSTSLLSSDFKEDYSIWPAVVQSINIPELTETLKYSLEPMVMILDDKSKSSFHREPLKLNMSGAKHTGYAFQWFTMAVVLLIIYFVVNTRKIKSD